MSGIKKRKLRYIHIVLIVIASVILVVTSALLITNIFVPVKYLGAYFTVANKNSEGELRMTFIDVGYGDSTVIELPDGKVILIDGGGDSYQSKYKVLQKLNSLGIDTVDYLVCSSVSAERCGGLSDILKYKTVKEIYIPFCPYTHVTAEYRSFILEMNEGDYITHTLEYGVGFYNEEHDYGLYVLSPSVQQTEGGEIDNFINEPSKKNIDNASAVLWFECKGEGFLLLGNARSEVLDKLANKFLNGFEFDGKVIDVTSCKLVKVPNHGAAANHLSELLEKFDPKVAVMSVGENGYACPAAQTVSDVQNCVFDNFYRTDYDGSVTVTLSDGVLSVAKEKK